MKALLIEDDPATAQAVELMLRSDGHNVDHADLGKEGVDLATLYDFDVILLDINLPDITGWVVLEKLRSTGVKAPVIIVSGLAAIEDRVKGLDLGADDYMTKPFHRDELLARMRAVVRRRGGHTQSKITIGNVEVDLLAREVFASGSAVPLTPKEFDILETLLLRKGALVTKEQALERIYSGRDEPVIKIIDVLICKLRKKLADARGFEIKTVWGRGYTLVEAVS
jgi:two-component system cell cycle response regulator CtrA